MPASMPPFPGQVRGPCPSPQNRKTRWLALADLRKQRSALAAPLCSAHRSPASTTFFFLPPQCTFDAARMGRYSEPLLNGCSQFRGPNGRIA